VITKALAKSLLRIVQAEPNCESFPASGQLRAFIEEHRGIGYMRGSKILFTAEHKERIRALLKMDNIDPATPQEAWDGQGRSAALDMGPDEKWAGEAVRGRRISVKALRGQPLVVGGDSLYLPALANLEWSVGEAVARLVHASVIVVENWETFERIDDLQIDLTRAGNNPLVIWRGGGQHSTTGAARDFLSGYCRPVWSAPDYDPAGLAISVRLPNLAGVLAPPEPVLRVLLEKSRLHERYLQQLPGSAPMLDRSTHPDVVALWAMVRAAGKALPQERLLTSASQAPVSANSREKA